jgi:hypothetical protein
MNRLILLLCSVVFVANVASFFTAAFPAELRESIPAAEMEAKSNPVSLNDLFPGTKKSQLFRAYDNEEHRLAEEKRRLSSSNDNLYIAQVWGGDSCNGPLAVAQVIEVGICLTGKQYRSSKDPAVAVPDGVDDPNFKFVRDIDANGIIYEGTYYVQTKNSTSNTIVETTFCTESAMEQKRVELDEKYVNDGSIYVIGGSRFVNETSKIFAFTNIFNASYTMFNDKSRIIPKMDSCEPMMPPPGSSKNPAVDTPYGSMKLSKLSTLTKWVPSPETPGLCTSIGGSYSYVNVIQEDSVSMFNSIHFAYTDGQCLETATNLYGDSPKKFFFDSGLSGSHKFDVANAALYPADGFSLSMKVVATASGAYEVSYFNGLECKDPIWTLEVGGEMLPFYVAGAGQAQNKYFPDDDVKPGVGISYSSSIGYYASGSGSAPAPASKSPGAMGSMATWSSVYLYEGDKCDGAIYAKNSLSAGPLYRCFPDYDSAFTGNSPNPVVVGSYTIIPGSYPFSEKDPKYGFTKLYYKDLECTPGKEYSVDYTKPAFSAVLSTVTNNGSCFSIDLAPAQLIFGKFQTKSWRYVNSQSPPIGMGFSYKYYEGGCGGALIGGSTFDIKAGTNYSANSNGADAIPDTKPYTVATTCDSNSGIMTTTWTADDKMSVAYNKAKSVVYPISCEAFGTQAGTQDYLSRSCDGYTGPAGTSSSEGNKVLSGGAIAGIVIAVIVIIVMILGAGYYMSLNKKEVRRASMRASAANVSATATAPHTTQNPMRSVTAPAKDVVPAPTDNDV